MSSLAAQLAQNASLNASLLSTSRRKPTESYLFPASQAATHDLESLHFLAANAFLQLKSVQPACRKYEAALFSDAIKNVDRTLLNKEMGAELDANLAGFMRLLGPWLMEGMVGKILEWLVRRFRINEFNVEDVLPLFLPYHESPHFAKMLSILHIKPQTLFAFLLPFKAAAKHLPRASLVSAMVQDTDVARFVSSLLPNAHQGGYSHRALLAFNIGVMHEYILRSKILDEGIVGFVVGALVEALEGGSDANVVLGSYVLLSTLSQKCQLSGKATKAILGAMVESAPRVATGQFMKAAVAVCEPQGLVDELSDAVVGKVLKLANLDLEIAAFLGWVGSEKLLVPLLSGLISRITQESALTALQSIMTSPDAPGVILTPLTALLVTTVVSSDDETDLTLHRAMLSTIQQRHPTILQAVTEAAALEDEHAKETVEQLVISLSMVFSNDPRDKASADLVVASTSAEQNVRVIAVNGLLKAMATAEPTDLDLASIKSALLARAHDTKAAVIEALYSQPAILLPILSAESEVYIAAVTAVLAAGPARALVRAHLAFLAAHFCTANPALAPAVFDACFFPFLLFSKSNKATAKMVWEIIEKHGMGAYEVVKGCVDDWRWQMDKPAADPVDGMANTNMAVAARMAENILTSTNYEDHLAALLEKMQAENSHTRALAHLVARALLGGLSGDRQIDAANKMLVAMRLESLEGMEDIPEGRDSRMLVDDRSLGHKIVLKPAGHKTAYYLKTAIFALMPQISRPPGVALEWFNDQTLGTEHDKATRYVSLKRTIYKVANSSASLPLLSTSIISSLFLSLKDDALVFLAGIVAHSFEVKANRGMCVAALRHAASFMTAQPNVDFQAVLPSLIVAMMGADVDIREAALECVSIMAKNHKELTVVYGFDALYGESSSNLQYLDVADLKKYIQSITDSASLIAKDGNYFKIFHQQTLSRTKSDSKVQSKHKQHVLSYLLSHVGAIGSPKAQITLLDAIADVSDEIKAQMLAPLAQELTLPSQAVHRYGQSLDRYATLVVSAFDRSSASTLNEDDGVSWPVFASVVRYFLRSDALPGPRFALARNLERGLFVALSPERQVEICTLLLQIGAHDTNAVHCKKVLGNVIQTVPLMQSLLLRLQPAVSQTTPAKKRAKLDDNILSDDSFPSLTLLAEVLAASDLPGSLDLISRLLDSLNAILHYELSTQGDKSFVEQLLMSAIENTAEKVVEIPNLSPSAIRLDILVELIRVSNNTQTFHQALLLMANLARLTPESVLHNVMPVFTFMGSNVFHRDDTYSFRVVQQTVNSIVPVMVSSLKAKHTTRMDLFIGSKDFLRIFTDAAHHIPRHRRTKFFSHLVDVMGPDDFLAPIGMLLIDKVANRVHRQNAEEVGVSFALPLSIFQHYSTTVQISALSELLEESQRLVAHITSLDTNQPTFLDMSRDEEHTQPFSLVFRRRAQALVGFVGHVLQTSSFKHSGEVIAGCGIGDLVSLLVHLSTLRVGSAPDANIDPVVKAAQSTMSLSLGVMPAADFVGAVLAMLESGETKVQTGALDVLSSRLESVASTVRHSVTAVIVKIVDCIRSVVLGDDEPLVSSAFGALRVIGLTMCAGEENALANMVPSILAAIRDRKGAEMAMTSLVPLISGLGPRLITNLRDIIGECVSVVREGLASSAQMSAFVTDALSTLQGILVSIPAFWGSGEFIQVVRLHVDHSAAKNSQSTATFTLMKSVAKRAPAKVLLPTLCELWTSEDSSPQTDRDRMVAFFDLMKRALRVASRPVVLENIRPLFQVFLEAFDSPSRLSPECTAAVEARSIPAFLELVVKLNEAAFKPLFRKLYDWAFATDISNSRKITFCHVYTSLLEYFKGLMSTYMSFLLQPFTELLTMFAASSTNDKKLWLSVIETFTKSFHSDEGVFWRDDKLRQIAPTLVTQVPVCARFGLPEGKLALSSCLDIMTEAINDDALLKSTNLDLLMHTRSEDVRLRTFALNCAEVLWRSHGGKLLGFVAETTTFIAECAEDENDLVVKEANRLKNAVEGVAGNINELEI